MMGEIEDPFANFAQTYSKYVEKPLTCFLIIKKLSPFIKNCKFQQNQM